MVNNMRDILEIAGVIILVFFAYQFFFTEPGVEIREEVRYLPSPPIVLRDTLPAPPPIVMTDTVWMETGEPAEYERLEDAPITYEKEVENAELNIEVLPLALIDEVNVSREFIAYKGLWGEFVEYRGLHLQPRDNVFSIDIQLPPVEVREITRTVRRRPTIYEYGGLVGAGIIIGVIIN